MSKKRRLKIASYNINGINSRLHVLTRWLEEFRPDVVGHENQLRVGRLELDRGFRALEVVALRHFLARLVQSVVDFLQVDMDEIVTVYEKLVEAAADRPTQRRS